ncbi:MAG: leucyl/phenylalanyl-tRNA--protein transferase [Flavobacteriaceae bacterium]|jgi:leucyl/phenylalanyl-tRNA--protein transferase|nr:leucyl/phenylalanyl-tRNA--protein transferase [Flavobacteriaceae bacterium]
MYLLTDQLYFPPVETANHFGMLAVGGDLSVNRLILAYKSGIFPWYSDDEPIIWYSLNPRMVLFLNEFKIPKSLKSLLKKGIYTVTFNQNFEEVIHHCRTIQRTNQPNTWITDEMKNAYIDFHKAGFAKSVEVWKGDELVGGLYGVDLGNIFCGESMFSKEPNASKIGLVYLVEKLKIEKYQLIDCQMYTDYLASFGAGEILRNEFLNYLKIEFRV